METTKSAFAKIVQRRNLRSTRIFIYFNKIDVLREKLKYMESQDEDLDVYFPELRLGKRYKGAEEKILEHFKTQFAALAFPRKIHTWCITAVDTFSFREVFEETMDEILLSPIQKHHKKALVMNFDLLDIADRCLTVRDHVSEIL